MHIYIHSVSNISLRKTSFLYSRNILSKIKNIPISLRFIKAYYLISPRSLLHFLFSPIYLRLSYSYKIFGQNHLGICMSKQQSINAICVLTGLKARKTLTGKRTRIHRKIPIIIIF